MFLIMIFGQHLFYSFGLPGVNCLLLTVSPETSFLLLYYLFYSQCNCHFSPILVCILGFTLWGNFAFSRPVWFWRPCAFDANFCCCCPGCFAVAHLALCLTRSPCTSGFVYFPDSCLATGPLQFSWPRRCLRLASNDNACLLSSVGSLALWGNGTFELVVWCRVYFSILILCFLTSPFSEEGLSPSLSLFSADFFILSSWFT